MYNFYWKHILNKYTDHMPHPYPTRPNQRGMGRGWAWPFGTMYMVGKMEGLLTVFLVHCWKFVGIWVSTRHCWDTVKINNVLTQDAVNLVTESVQRLKQRLQTLTETEPNRKHENRQLYNDIPCGCDCFKKLWKTIFYSSGQLAPFS